MSAASAAADKKPTSTAKPASASSAASSAGSSGAGSPPPSGKGGGFWPGLVGGFIGGGAVALAALFYLNVGQGSSGLLEAIADLDGRLSAAESQVAATSTLSDRLAAVEESPALSGSGEEASGVADRLADLEQRLSTLDVGTAGDDGAVDERLAALEQRLAALDGDLAAVSDTVQSTEGALSSAQTGLASNGTAIETLQQMTEGLGADVGSLTDRVGEAETRLESIGGEYQRAAGMVMAIGDIDRAITRAEPFAESLASLRTLGKDDPEVGEAVTALDPMAASGAPTLSALKNSFGEAGSRILLSEDGDEALVDQVRDNVFGIINMRPAGAEVEGDDARAIVARAQAKLNADDLDGAVAELSGLDEASRQGAEGWLADARARLAADAALADLRAYAQDLLAKGS